MLFDTGGRFQIDNELVAELSSLKEVIKPVDVVLVLDAATGQESVHVAEQFHSSVGLSGLILTKLDGDARGGAALSVGQVTQCPILLVGTGEHLEDLEPFYPDRMASRILGMGDVVSLVEKAQASLEGQELEGLEKKLKKKSLDLDDFLVQIQQMRKLGPIENLLEMLPAGVKLAGDSSQMARSSEKDLSRTEAIIRSMTLVERRKPSVLNASRRRRIAKGSGTSVAEVNQLLKRFSQAQKMAKKFARNPKKWARMKF